jgi:hypothetical protein
MVRWNRLIGKIIAWCVIELLLNAAGLDQLADYGEFLEEQLHWQTRSVMLCGRM